MRSPFRRLARYAAMAVIALALLIAAGLAATQTGWFKNWLRGQVVSQATRYLNGTLTIDRLRGSLFTGLQLDGVTLVHEGVTTIAIGTLTVSYSPMTMISTGLVLDSLVLDRPTILIQRDGTGWNFNRFVRTRANTGGRGAPPITMEAITINDGHLIVKDRGRLIDELTGFNSELRFAYLKPGIQIDISRLSGDSPNVSLHALAGDLGFTKGAIDVRGLTVETGRSAFVTTFVLGGAEAGKSRALDVSFHADRLSLPEVAHYFAPLANINLEPAVDIKGHGTMEALAMDVSVVSPAGNALGRVVGHFAKTPGLEGTLNVEHVDMQPILNRKEWKTLVTGEARFNWVFSPMKVNFTFAGPEAQGLGYRAANVRAQGVYEPSLLKFDASGTSYGTTATTRATFHFASAGRPLSYTLAGDFRDLDMRRLPPTLSMPKLASQAAGRYQFEATGRDWRGSGELRESIVEGARFAPGFVLEMDSQNRALHYSASGHVTELDPRRFASPLEVTWLDDERFHGSLTGAFTFTGSGRTVDELELHTTASLSDSTLAGAHFPEAQVDFRLADRHMRSTFSGPFEHLPGSLLTARPELADTMLNGTADATVALVIPKVGPLDLQELSGSATLVPSTIAGLSIDKAQVTASFANQIAEVKELVVTGSEVQASASGTLAMGESGQSDMRYDIAVTNLGPVAKRFGETVLGGAHLVGVATGPSSGFTLSGTFAANRLVYGSKLEALAADGKYTVEVPDFDFERARIQAGTTSTFVTIAGHNLSRVTAETTYLNKELEFTSRFEELGRSLDLGGTVLLHPDHDEIHLRAMSLAVGEAQWALQPGTQATVHYASDSVRLENFVLQRGAQQLVASGTVAIGSGSASMPNDLTVRLDNVLVQDVNELLLGQRPLAGLLNANAKILGTRSDPRVQAEFALTGGSVQEVKFDSLTGNASYAGRAVDVDVRLQQTPTAVLTAVGVIPVPSGPGGTVRTDEFDLMVKSTPIELGLFQAATTQLTDMTGHMTANVHIGGTIEAPRLKGLVEAIDAGFVVRNTSVVYRNALVRLNFEEDRLFIDRFQVSDEDGDQLVAIGELGIVRRSLGAMNMQVSTHRFKILDNQFGQVDVDSDLRISGDASKPSIAGEVSAQGARLEVDQLLEELTRSPYSTEATEGTTSAALAGAASALLAATQGTSATPGLYDAATVDVRVRLLDDLVLRGRDMQASFSRIGLGDMNVTVGGDLQVRKAPGGEPDLVGTVSVIRGFYDFQGRRFEVLRDSQIHFQGADPTDPALQVSAERLISGVTAIVNIRGSVRQPSVTLSSTPPMDEADVLSLIVFNQPLNQLGQAERLNLVERAGSMAAGYLTTPLANSIADALDLDLLEIRTAGGINGQPSVALGQQFGSRLFVSFRQDFGATDYSQVSLEYRINDLLRLVSTVAQGGNSSSSYRADRTDLTGADLIFVISY